MDGSELKTNSTVSNYGELFVSNSDSMNRDEGPTEVRNITEKINEVRKLHTSYYFCTLIWAIQQRLGSTVFSLIV